MTKRLPKAGRRHIDLTAGKAAPFFCTPEQVAEGERRQAIAQRIRAAYAALDAGVAREREREEANRRESQRELDELKTWSARLGMFAGWEALLAGLLSLLPRTRQRS